MVDNGTNVFVEALCQWKSAYLGTSIIEQIYIHSGVEVMTCCGLEGVGGERQTFKLTETD